MKKADRQSSCLLVGKAHYAVLAASKMSSNCNCSQEIGSSFLILVVMYVVTRVSGNARSFLFKSLMHDQFPRLHFLVKLGYQQVLQTGKVLFLVIVP